MKYVRQKKTRKERNMIKKTKLETKKEIKKETKKYRTKEANK